MEIKSLLLIVLFVSAQLFGSDDPKTVLGVNSGRAKQGAVFLGACVVLTYIGYRASQEEMALHDKEDKDSAVSQGVAPALPKTKTGIFGFFERFMTRFMGCDELIADIEEEEEKEKKELAGQALKTGSYEKDEEEKLDGQGKHFELDVNPGDALLGLAAGEVVAEPPIKGLVRVQRRVSLDLVATTIRDDSQRSAEEKELADRDSKKEQDLETMGGLVSSGQRLTDNGFFDAHREAKSHMERIGSDCFRRLAYKDFDELSQQLWPNGDPNVVHEKLNYIFVELFFKKKWEEPKIKRMVSLFVQRKKKEAEDLKQQQLIDLTKTKPAEQKVVSEEEVLKRENVRIMRIANNIGQICADAREQHSVRKVRLGDACVVQEYKYQLPFGSGTEKKENGAMEYVFRSLFSLYKEDVHKIEENACVSQEEEAQFLEKYKEWLMPRIDVLHRFNSQLSDERLEYVVFHIFLGNNIALEDVEKAADALILLG